MREVEIKARVKYADSLLVKLADMGVVLSDPSRQLDDIFVVRPKRLSQTRGDKSPIVRIRAEGKNITLTLKRDVTDQLDCIEHEVRIDDPVAMNAILEELNYHQVISVDKMRRKFMIGGFGGCLDDVKGLGSFIELEAMCDDDADADDIRREMWKVLGALDINTTDEMLQGYDRLLEASITGVD